MDQGVNLKIFSSTSALSMHQRNQTTRCKRKLTHVREGDGDLLVPVVEQLRYYQTVQQLAGLQTTETHYTRAV